MHTCVIWWTLLLLCDTLLGTLDDAVEFTFDWYDAAWCIFTGVDVDKCTGLVCGKVAPAETDWCICWGNGVVTAAAAIAPPCECVDDGLPAPPPDTDVKFDGIVVCMIVELGTICISWPPCLVLPAPVGWLLLFCICVAFIGGEAKPLFAIPCWVCTTVAVLCVGDGILTDT